MSRTTIGNRRIATITAIIALVVFCLGSFAQKGFTQTITAYDLYMNPNDLVKPGFFVRAGMWIYAPVPGADDFKLRPATIYPYGRIRVDSGGTLLFDQLSFGAGTPAEDRGESAQPTATPLLPAPPFPVPLGAVQDLQVFILSLRDKPTSLSPLEYLPHESDHVVDVFSSVAMPVKFLL